jgi:phage tail sheath protein FI
VFEEYDDVLFAESDEGSPNYIEERLQDGVSALLEVERIEGQAPDLPDTAGFLGDSGADGSSPVLDDFTGANRLIDDKRFGLAALEEPRFQDVAIVYAPVSGVAGVEAQVVDHCDRFKYRFAIVDVATRTPSVSAINPRSTIADTQYGAAYYPWIRILDPLTNNPKFVPPGGYVAGIYARSDTERGVWKAPANETVRGAIEVEFETTDGEQANLNPKGVNVIRSFYNRGIRVWGARTLSSNALWKYVNVRRLFIFLEASIYRGTQWVVFEPNNERLWVRVRETIEQFLRGQWRQGAMMGLREQEAFYVRADRSTMSQDDIDNGRLIVEIGIAPVKPAEFVIFRITQFTANREG